MSTSSSSFVPQVSKPISPPYSPESYPIDSPDRKAGSTESHIDIAPDTPVLTPLSADSPAAGHTLQISSIDMGEMSDVAENQNAAQPVNIEVSDLIGKEDRGVSSKVPSARPSFEIAGQSSLGIRRGHSPAPITRSKENGFASSSSTHPTGSVPEQRGKHATPTRAGFEANHTSPPRLNDTISAVKARGLGIDDASTWSSYDQTLHAHPLGNARARSPYVHSPTVGPSEKQEMQPFPAPNHPLTSDTEYNQATSKDHGAREKFTDSAAYWLGLYFFFNLGLTLFNKVVLVSFPFPYTLTGLHALSGCAGTYFALERGAFIPARLNQTETLILAAFSVLYTINIAVSNISLQLVTVPFHQVVRASTPLFTIVISTVVLRTRFSMKKLVSLLPVVAGVGFATYGDYYFTAWGLILTLLGTFLAALKTVVTNLIQTGGGQRLKLHPLDLLMRMSPMAFIQCVIYGWYTGELDRVRQYGATQMTTTKAVALLINGIIACGLNIVSFTANKKAGALTMTVSANCKQVLTIALAVVLFNLNISATNGIGILLTLIGGAWYGYVEYMEKKKKTTTKIVDRS